MKGDLATSAEVAQEALAAAERTGDALDRVGAHYQVGAPLLLQGRFSRALHHLEHSIEFHDSSAHGAQAYAMGIDRGINAYAYVTLCHVYRGHPDRALAVSEEAMALARRVKHPFTLANALFFLAYTHVHRGELDRAR